MLAGETAPRMARRRKDKPVETLEDPFLEGAGEWTRLLEANFRWILLGVIALLAVVVGAEQFGESAEEDSAARMASLQAQLDRYQSLVDPRYTMTATSSEKLAADYRSLSGALEKVRSDWPADGTTQLALLLEADTLRRAGAAKEASERYQQALAAAPASALGFLAQEGLGYSFEEAGNSDAALAAFTKLAESGPSFYQDYGWKHVGRLHESAGRTKEAVAAYEKIVQRQPPSPLKDFADERLRSLR